MSADVTKAIGEVLRAIGAYRGWHVPGLIAGNALPYADLTYSLAGEDVALKATFKRELKEAHAYVDIGCGAPITISNTYLFYCLGWRGLCVDANAGLAETWTKDRSGDTFIAAAVSDNSEAKTFYRHAENTGMSLVANGKPEGNYESGVKVEVHRLDALLERHIGEKPIKFMNLDVEGAELEVLRSNNWDRYRPEAILMECHEFDFTNPLAAPSVSYLSEQGYVLSQKIGANVLMIRKELWPR